MQGRCTKHLFESAEDRCGKCGLEFCGECLVYAFGPKRPPYCIPCAVAAAGIRAAAGNRPAVPKRELKRLEKERAASLRRFRRGRRDTEPVAETVGEPVTVESFTKTVVADKYLGELPDTLMPQFVPDERAHRASNDRSYDSSSMPIAGA